MIVGAMDLAESVVHASGDRFNSLEPVRSSVGLRLCPRRFTGWILIERLETARYALALCQRDDVVYLVGHEKAEHEAFLEARIVRRAGRSFVAEGDDGITFEGRSGKLTVFRDGQIISREVLRRSSP